jgi:hypothetical protein
MIRLQKQLEQNIFHLLFKITPSPKIIDLLLLLIFSPNEEIITTIATIQVIATILYLFVT